MTNAAEVDLLRGELLDRLRSGSVHKGCGGVLCIDDDVWCCRKCKVGWKCVGREEFLENVIERPMVNRSIPRSMDMDCEDILLKARLRDFYREMSYRHYSLCGLWLLCWKVMLGMIHGDKNGSRRLEFARDVYDLRHTPMALTLRIFGVKWRLLRKRIGAACTGKKEN